MDLDPGVGHCDKPVPNPPSQLQILLGCSSLTRELSAQALKRLKYKQRQPIISAFINRDASDCIGLWHHWRKSGPLLFTALLRFIEVCGIRPCTALWALQHFDSFLFQSFWCRSAVLGSSAVGQMASHWYREEFVVHSVTVRSRNPHPSTAVQACCCQTCVALWHSGQWVGLLGHFWGRNSKVVCVPSELHGVRMDSWFSSCWMNNYRV